MNSWNRLYRYTQTASVALASLLFLFIFKVPDNPYVAFALAGSYVAFIAADRNPLRHVAVLIGALLYALIYKAGAPPIEAYQGWWAAYPGGMLGLAAVVTTMLRWFWTTTEGAAAGKAVTAQAIIPALCAIAVVCVGIGIRLTPYTYDYNLYAFDSTFGSPSFALARWFNLHGEWFSFSAAIYNALPLWASITWLLLGRTGATGQERRWSFIVLGVAGFVLYQLCPAGGPRNRFHETFPAAVANSAIPTSGAALLGSFAPRNAMPSLHIAWALLICCCSLDWKWPLRVAAAFIAVFTLFAMLGSGEHYLIDALVSVPLVAAVLAAPARSVRARVRRTLTAVCATITVVWLIALRTAVALSLPCSMRMVAAGLTVTTGVLAVIVLRRSSPHVNEAQGPAAAELAADRNSVTQACPGVT